MSSIHNDLATWAGRARALGFNTINIDLKTAEAASAKIVEQANEIADLEQRVKQLEEEASFLLDRLREFESEMDYGEVSVSIYREYSGHVTPSIARLRALLNGGSNERA